MRAWSPTRFVLVLLSALHSADASAEGQAVPPGTAAQKEHAHSVTATRGQPAHSGPPAPGQLPPHSSTSSVGQGDAVITVHGFCANTPASSALPCDTVITRAQFDQLAEALQPDMPRPLRLKVANTYARIMRMAAAAKKRGLDKTAAFEEELRYARMQLLSQDLTQVLQKEAQNVNAADIANYYNAHRPFLERATLERIFVPGAKPAAASSTARDDTNLQELAITLRARALAGESPEALQIEAFKAAGTTVAKTHTKIENVQRDSLPPSHESVMDLRVGDVSEVLTDPDGGHFIYKMIDKRTPSLDDLAPEIRDRISSQRYNDSMKGFEGDVVFNDAYFDPPETHRGHQQPAK